MRMRGRRGDNHVVLGKLIQLREGEAVTFEDKVYCGGSGRIVQEL
jgi:hypothetical protein